MNEKIKMLQVAFRRCDLNNITEWISDGSITEFEMCIDSDMVPYFTAKHIFYDEKEQKEKRENCTMYLKDEWVDDIEIFGGCATVKFTVAERENGEKLDLSKEAVIVHLIFYKKEEYDIEEEYKN